MKPILLLTATFAFAFALTSCGDKNSSTDNPDQAPNPSAGEPASDYPLDVCVVSGEKLGSMGKPVIIDHEGTEVRFCCKDCVADFNKDPDKYLAMLKAGKVEGTDPDDSKP